MKTFNLGKMTFGSLFKKPETILYPVQEKEPPAGLKGQVINNVENCILCGICEKRCPCGAIDVNKAEHTWSIDRFRCVQCVTCVRECPKDCLSMLPHHPAPATSKSTSVFTVPEREKGSK